MFGHPFWQVMSRLDADMFDQSLHKYTFEKETLFIVWKQLNLKNCCPQLQRIYVFFLMAT